MSYIITKFRRSYSKDYYHIDLDKELSLIKGGFYKEPISRCRQAYLSNKSDEYKKMKSELPAVAFCGKFEGGHSSKDLVDYNEIMILDVDGLNAEELPIVWGKLCSNPHTHAIWISPSGAGIKGLVKIKSTPETHKLVFNSLRNYLQEKIDILIDKSGSDYTRLCYVSWDPNIYINYSSITYIDEEVFAIEKKEFAKKSKEVLDNDFSDLVIKNRSLEGLNKPSHRILIKRIIKFLKKRGISITSTYYDWVKVCFAISNSFSYEIGEPLFLEICRIDGEKHSEVKSKNLFRRVYNLQVASEENITFSSIVYLAKQAGFKK